MTKVSLLFAFSIVAAWAGEVHPGATVPDFKVYDSEGKAVASADLRGSVTVVGFISTQCPVSNGYNDRMSALFRDYASKGVKFRFINSNVNEPMSEVQSHAKSVGFPFPVFKDRDNAAADLFGAQSTPEMYVVDGSGIVRYHGAIDDSPREPRVKVRRIRAALDAVLAGKPVEEAETKAFGCTIKRARKST